MYLNFMPDPEIIKLFSCSTQPSMLFQLLIKTKMLKKINIFLTLKLSDAVFILLINVKMQIIVGRINFILSGVEHDEFYNLGAWSSFILEMKLVK